MDSIDQQARENPELIRGTRGALVELPVLKENYKNEEAIKVHDIKKKQMVEIQERGFQINPFQEKKEAKRKLEKIRVINGFL